MVNVIELQELRLFTPDLSHTKLPELTPTDAAIRDIDIEGKGMEQFESLLIQVQGLQGSFALAKIDEMIVNLVTNEIEEIELPEDVKARAKRAATEKNWAGVVSESGEHFVLRELIVRTNRIRFQLIQEWVKSAPDSGLNPVAEKEYECLMPAMAAVDSMYLAMATEKYPIDSNERKARGLVNPCAVVQEIDGKVREISWSTVYPKEMSAIVSAYDDLIANLENIAPGNEELAARKIGYYKAVRKAFATCNIEDWKKADLLLTSQIRNGNDVFHVHPIEDAYMKDRIIRSPEISLRAPDLNAERAGMLSEKTKATMIKEWEKLAHHEPAIAGSLQLLMNSNAAVRHFLGAGWEMDLKLAGQAIPNEFEERENGLDSSLTKETIPERVKALKQAFIKVFGAEVYETIVAPRVDIDYMVGVDIASHELGHITAINKTTFDRLGDKDMVLPNVEEWKATVSGAIGAMYLPYLSGNGSIQELENFIAIHIGHAVRFGAMRDHAFSASYFRKSMMMTKVMEDVGILTESGEGEEFPWKINIDSQKVLAFFEVLYTQWIDLIRIYDIGTEEDIRSFLAKNLTITPFLKFLGERLPIKNTDGADNNKATIEALVQIPQKKGASVPTAGETIQAVSEETRTAIKG